MDDMQLVLDEQAITRQLVNYCRSMDRCDHELGYAVFHAGAQVEYPDIYTGTARGFVDETLAGHLYLAAHLHRVTNISIVVDGDQAGSETYVDAQFRMVIEGQLMWLSNAGRYIDRWAKLDGRWAITSRRYVHGMDSSGPAQPGRFVTGGARDRTDMSYEVLDHSGALRGA